MWAKQEEDTAVTMSPFKMSVWLIAQLKALSSRFTLMEHHNGSQLVKSIFLDILQLKLF